MKEIFLKDYIEPNYLIPNVELYINILEKEAVVTSMLTIVKNCSGDTPLVLDGKELKLHSVLLDGKEIFDFDYSDDKLTIKNLPNKAVLTTTVSIDPYNNKSMEGFYKSGNILCTQNEAEGFRRVTFFSDRPDVMSKYTITVEGDKKVFPKLLSNGNLVESTPIGENRLRNKWEDPFAKPCYLVAIVAGDLESITDSFTTKSGRVIDLEIYTDPGQSNKAYHAMESLKKSMKWDEDTFGLEYDLDLYMVVAVDSFNAGAMENKGLNIFNSAYVLADPKTATDSDFEGVEGVIAHEYFHNWTGNRVTCRDWFQLTLKEGLTVFRDQEFSSDKTDRTVKRISDVSILRSHQYPEDKGPNSHPIKPESYFTIDNFYTATVYEKGAEVIRMIFTLLGKEKFRAGMDLYFKRHTGEAVTTEDFVSAMEDASGFDLTQFKRWYSQAGTPVISVDSSYNNGEFTLKVKQEIPKTSYNCPREPLFFPFPIGLYDKDGRDLTPEAGKNLIISKEYEEFTFKTENRVIPSLAQGFSAPIEVRYNYSTDELITLLTADKDKFNKFDAARRLTMISIDTIIGDIRTNRECSIDKRIIESYKKLLTDPTLEKRYLATLLYIPEVKDIALTMEEYDFKLANRARNIYLKQLATELKSNLFRLFEDNLAIDAVAERSIKNSALSILSFLGDDIAEIAQKQFALAENMTDYMAAFMSLQKCSDTVRIEANKSFKEKWKDNFLVMNKWFITQAIRDDETVLDDIKKLSLDELFDNTNPNRIRSLFGAFAGRNSAHFHSEDGQGYKFIADKIIDIDSYNSHVSSSLASAFQPYKYLGEKQAKLMKEQLIRISQKEGISTGLNEIILKTLKARD
ncbi:aminopeptidase N [Thiospirochaeta perfilievii]|uniref:Aminopeptidase N n=1 Tax=Thiospirochaeta perfilievii TaxID=252967 RepID=A0A5C1QGZ2_9SPIO|nr:aminopeptidase N [Thiospirochaeta perfilievii]QEN05512.1 aminopeptidase N [Thiospirochaeta perfilievii]